MCSAGVGWGKYILKIEGGRGGANTLVLVAHERAGEMVGWGGKGGGLTVNFGRKAVLSRLPEFMNPTVLSSTATEQTCLFQVS